LLNQSKEMKMVQNRPIQVLVHSLLDAYASRRLVW